MAQLTEKHALAAAEKRIRGRVAELYADCEKARGIECTRLVRRSLVEAEHLLRAVPELGAILPPNAVGRDFRPLPFIGASDSGAGVEASLWGVLRLKLGWIEGVEVNLFGLVAGLDVRRPAVKLPGFGRIGVDGLAPAPAAARDR